MEEFGLAYVLISFVEIGMLVTLPLLVAKGFVLIPALVLAALSMSTILLSRIFVGWFLNPADEMREGEGPIVQVLMAWVLTPVAKPLAAVVSSLARRRSDEHVAEAVPVPSVTILPAER